MIPLTRASCPLHALLVGLALLGCNHAPGPLTPADLTVAGVSVDQDSAVLYRVLGSSSGTDPSDLRYGNVSFFLRDGAIAIISVTGPGYATARGLQVGDKAERVLSLYQPCYADSAFVQICYPTDDFDPRAITVSLASGHVTRFNVGRILEP